MAKTTNSRKKSKISSEKPKGSSSGDRGPESEASLQAFMEQAIGSQNDAYLKKLAMTVVQLQAMSEITSLQSSLLKKLEKFEDRALIEHARQYAGTQGKQAVKAKEDAVIASTLKKDETDRASDLEERRRKALAEAEVIRAMMAAPKKVFVRKQPELTVKRAAKIPRSRRG